VAASAVFDRQRTYPQLFGDLPIALIGAGGSGGTRIAQNARLSLFHYLKIRPLSGHALYVDRASARFDKHNRLSDEATREQLRAVVAGFAAHCGEVPRTRAS
jgi:NAD(P)H-dependent FMN reductase